MNKKAINEVLDNVNYETLDNGFKIISYESEVFNKTYVNYCTRYGALDYSFKKNGLECNYNKGIAHFLEHIMFNMPYGDAFENFSKNQANANAYTSYDKTSYLFSASENVLENLKNLLDMVNTFYLPKEKLEKEKGIIIEEIGMYDKQAFWKLYMDTFKNSLKSSKYKDDILGYKNDINTMTYDMLKDTYDNFYTPDNQFIVIVGKDIKESIKFIKNYMGQKEANENKVEKIIEKEDLKGFKEDNLIELDFSQKYTSLVFKYLIEEEVKPENKIALTLLLDYVYSRLNKDFDQVILNKELDYTFDFDHLLHSNYGLLMFFVENKEKEEVLKALDKIDINIEQWQVKTILNQAIGKLFKRFNDEKALCEFLINIEIDKISIKEYYSILENLEFDKIIEKIKNDKNIKISTKIDNKML